MSKRDGTMTRQKKLRTGTPVWATSRRSPLPHSPLTKDISTDVLVIGSGISGALIAEALSECDLKVVIVDRRSPMCGSTPASTALLQYELDVPLIHLQRQVGAKKAERIWKRSFLAMNALYERTRRLQIHADQVRRDSLYLAGNVLSSKELLREAHARSRIGFEVETLNPKQLWERYRIHRTAALRSGGNFTAHPVHLAAGFLRQATARKARIFTPVEIVDVEAKPRSVISTTANGQEIRSRHVVFATGYELPKQISMKSHSIASTYAIATAPQVNHLWNSECLIWEASEPYLYLRTTPDGRVICGGEDEPFEDEAKRDALISQKTKKLEHKLKALFPQVNTHAEFQWTGSFGVSDTGAPSIGRVPHMKNCFVAMGFGGNGITFSMLAAQLLRGLITGVGDTDEDLFAL